MEAILSSEGFNPNEALWAKTSSSSEKEFLIEEKESGELHFEGKPLSSLIKGATGTDEELVEEAVLIDIDSDDEEAQPAEPAEPTVTLTESEYSHKIAQAKAEVESRLKEDLETRSRVELDQLKERQEEFFRAVMESMTGDTLAADVAALSLKIGAFLARSQLRLDEKVVSEFVESSTKGNEFNESDFVSVRVSDTWQPYSAALNSVLPPGLGLVFDESLHPGDVVVSAGQGGYFDLLRDRVKMIEDQLGSIEHPDSPEWLTDSLKQFISGGSVGVLEESGQQENTQAAGPDEQVMPPDGPGQLKPTDSGAFIGEAASMPQEHEIEPEEASPEFPENGHQEISQEHKADNGPGSVDNEADQ